MTHQLLHLLVVIAFGGQAPRPDSTASVAGRIRTNKGKPTAGALVILVGSRLTAQSDSHGHFVLRGLPAGSAHLHVHAFGFESVDTTVSLRSGQRLVWNVVIRQSDWFARLELRASTWAAEEKRQAAAQAAAGALDSVGAGLVSTDTSAAFTYERFGIQLLRAAIKHSTLDSSRVLSPLSAGQALALALGAAKDSTAIAIADALNLGGLGSEGIASRSRRFDRAMAARRDLTLKIANALWVDTSAALQPDFARWARANYNAAVRMQPLHVPDVAAVMNRWADSVTNGAIKKIRTKEFAASVEVALTNAVYFRGRWLEPFDSSSTQIRIFTTAMGERVATPTMERTASLAYRRGPGYQALRVPYTAGLTALYIVLPDSGVSAAAVLEDLGRTGWPMPDPRKEPRLVDIRIPRLHLTQATDLRPAFTDLGMGILFDSSRADFGGLVVPRPGRPPPCVPRSSGAQVDPCTRYRISEAVQHVYMDVDEEGTVAVAVTTVDFGVVVTSVPPPPIQFFVDRPFLFALRDEKTGTLLFVGCIVAPSQ